MEYATIRAAYERIREVVHQTPVITSRTLNQITGKTIFLKCENFQRGGAFKFRGAYNTIMQLSEEEKRHGVVAYSSGNHAQAVALAARLCGTRAVICMPEDCPAVKLEATKGYGAEIVLYDRHAEDREEVAKKLAEERGLTIIPPYDHPSIIAGAGTAALELLEQVSDLDAVMTAVGGGGLISGTSLATHGKDPAIRIYGVEPDTADDARQSLKQGERVMIAPPATIADGLRSQVLGELTFPMVKEHVADILTVTDEEILAAVQFALLRLKIVIEPSGAVPLAAALFHKLPSQVKRIGIIISGGNIDPQVLSEALDRKFSLI
ncbi:threo-3-hydroxy-L-aspartate ammonia-lyase [Thermoflavimicrobium dichotomicum]|uniref:threonine ammonia-lyase n=1 Tax=Thermoflavimicrobium dichotomicum TaxID=46223 RepID=A0A1I3TVV3_9BACL|nr:threo-3-hydroxy-L-aspartate ammonia-lyase [Thermoflavimicrobium dichotomicum]SFJ75408.1 threonine dehydratase [Thermoflavimicrobium dichotomicum]